MTPLLSRLMSSQAPAAVLLVRILAGLVFVPEGLKKFLFPEQWGAGRFERIGLPAPELLAQFVGGVELLGGLLLLIGLMTRPAAATLVVDMLVALGTTKVPLLWRATAVSTKVGFWAFQSESRTDWAMLMALVFLAVVGAGPLSLDAKLQRGV